MADSLTMFSPNANPTQSASHYQTIDHVPTEYKTSF